MLEKIGDREQGLATQGILISDNHGGNISPYKRGGGLMGGQLILHVRNVHVYCTVLYAMAAQANYVQYYTLVCERG